MIVFVGISVGQYKFKHKQNVYNSGCYKLSLTAGTELNHRYEYIVFYLNES